MCFVLKTIETIETIFYFKKNIGISQNKYKQKNIVSIVSIVFKITLTDCLEKKRKQEKKEIVLRKKRKQEEKKIILKNKKPQQQWRLSIGCCGCLFKNQ